MSQETLTLGGLEDRKQAMEMAGGRLEPWEIEALKDPQDRAKLLTQWRLRREWEAEYRRVEGKLCLHRLSGKRCRCAWDREKERGHSLPYADHTTLWKHRQTGEMVYVTQPYPLSPEAQKKIADFAQARGYQLTIRDDSWHNYGDCLRIEVRAIPTTTTQGGYRNGHDN